FERPLFVDTKDQKAVQPALLQIVDEWVSAFPLAHHVHQPIPDDVKFWRWLPKLLPAVLAKVDERIMSRLGDIGIVPEVILGVEEWRWVEALANAVLDVVTNGIDAGLGDLRI